MKATIFTSAGEVREYESPAKDLVDAYLLDHLRGAMSFGQKAFALVLDGQATWFVIVESNSSVWLEPANFFERLEVESRLS